ncbi:uncharacterized protein LOC142775331 [Rhipicephalus microplus]|uniref:uncharacterized protein LOC142775331 n=1 Tax=Rhipicephalus microplus TaxID=6941 RepID=UPI003F6B44D6
MPSTSKKKTQRWCFVPGCDSGYRSCSEKVSLFRAPTCQELFLKWARAIPRADKPLQENSAVCAKHFDERFIQREFRHIVNGVEVSIPRDVPLLRDDAVPTLFPNLPKYISKTLPKERKRQGSNSMEENMSVKCSIFLSSFLHCQRDIRSEEEAQEALFYRANLAVCCGVGRMQEFHQVDLSNVTKSTGGSLYANACNGSVSLGMLLIILG